MSEPDSDMAHRLLAAARSIPPGEMSVLLGVAAGYIRAADRHAADLAAIVVDPARPTADRDRIDWLAETYGADLAGLLRCRDEETDLRRAIDAARGEGVAP